MNNELYHYGVLGMKWGVRRYTNPDGSLNSVGRRRDNSLRKKAVKYSKKATIYAKEAKKSADYGENGSRYLEKSDKYINKANKTIRKMYSDDTFKNTDPSYNTAKSANMIAGQKYIERNRLEKVAILTATTAMSAGMVFTSSMMGLPLTMIYISSGTKYKLNNGEY